MIGSSAIARLSVQMIFLLVLGMSPCMVYGKAGLLEPIIRVGAPAIVVTENSVPPGGNESVENDTFAAENAPRNVWASRPAASGKRIPNTIVLAGLVAPGATCQWAFFRICEIWIARNSASGSPSMYRRFTDPGWAAKAVSSADAIGGEITRQATTRFIFSVSNRALAASFSNSAALTNASPAVFPASMPCFFASATWAATPSLYKSKASLAALLSAFCSRITAYVEIPTTMAASAPIPRNITTKLFQELRSRPSIRLTFLETVVFSICAISCTGLLVIVLLSIINLFRET
jgi:hypothetical protein